MKRLFAESSNSIQFNAKCKIKNLQTVNNSWHIHTFVLLESFMYIDINFIIKKNRNIETIVNISFCLLI